MTICDCNPDTLDAADDSRASLPCDHWHHYYHYQASAQYVWLAETLRALGRMEEAREAYGKAVFQDHQNQEAIEAMRSLIPSPSTGEGQGGGDKTDGGEASPPSLILPRKGGGNIKYDKHPLTDIAFCASVGQLPTEATQLHDEGISAWLAGDEKTASISFERAIAREPTHSNSFFARGRLAFARQDYEKALSDLTEAVHLSHLHHDAYHRAASAEHLARGRAFLAAGDIDLAIADFTKALDLWRGNKEALAAKEEAHKIKGRELTRQT